MKVHQEQYGQFAIRAGLLNGEPTARAFSGPRVVAEKTGESLEQALAEVKAAVDALQSEARAQRRGGIPTAKEFVQAFERLDRRIGHHHWLMLSAHYHAEDKTMTAGELARSAGYRSYASANEKYGVLGKMLARELGHTPEMTDNSTGAPVWTFTLAEAGLRTEEDHFTWKMRSEVARALEILNAV